MKYLGNVLTKQFGLELEMHEEFAKTFRENSNYLGITSGIPAGADDSESETTATSPSTVTLSNAGRGFWRFYSQGLCHLAVC